MPGLSPFTVLPLFFTVFTVTAIFGEKTLKNGKEYPSLVR
jgi:hypothetical protein